ncbi:suppressor of fused domain protein [Streptomyces sp. NBC_00658]|uniref:suppressor of fused domain protein n=1 Tax=Streptomyces sp. NBC_00658 TaxID=2975800 RepID=UPI003255F70E
MTDTPAAPGWDAIDAALAPLYPNIEPRHVGYYPPMGFAGGALQGCSAYRAEGQWHYVTYGLSALYGPEEDDDPEWSGWGFEFTLRVPRGDEDQPPQWPYQMLQEMAKHVSSNQVLLEAGHRIDFRQPVTGHPHLPDAPPTGLTVFAFMEDPQLGTINTPHGKVIFLQAVGITAEEKARMLESSMEQVLELLAQGNPQLVTDPARAAWVPLERCQRRTVALMGILESALSAAP